MNFYSIRHLTKFRYERAVSESVMEVRMQPRSDTNQRCLAFSLSVSPRCRVFPYRDHLGNNVHHFDIPGEHWQLVIVAESLVEKQTGLEIPHFLAPDAWTELDSEVAEGDFWEMLMPSDFAKPSPLLLDFGSELGVSRRDDPLMVLRELNAALYQRFTYVQKSTHVDSPIDDALMRGEGVCQDFAHIMIALARNIGIPCRYVSGYLHHRKEDHDRSVEDATHAWVEAFIPTLGWVGFDPTNNLIADERHVRTAIGRDYADVPPTRGIFRGHNASELSVAVRVTASTEPPAFDAEMPVPEDWSMLVEKAQAPVLPDLAALVLAQQQQQQQQQQDQQQQQQQ
jgi:transglutaminase-like putative cysteine protease